MHIRRHAFDRAIARGAEVTAAVRCWPNSASWRGSSERWRSRPNGPAARWPSRRMNDGSAAETVISGAGGQRQQPLHCCRSSPRA